MRVGAARIELRVRSTGQLFNSMDPSPFHERDLDDDAAEFITGSALEAERGRELEIVVHVDEASAGHGGPAIEEAVHNFFAYRAEQSRRQMRELMRHGRLTLLIGLLFLSACLGVVRALDAVDPEGVLYLVREALVIVGWVALWRPLEIFLYDWWPIRRQRRLFERLSRAGVELRVRERA